MANIRFVKPPNDNSRRTYPAPMMINDVINIASSTKNEVGRISAPKMNNVIHITTPKRSTINKSTSDIFNNKNNNDQTQVMKPSVNSDRRLISDKSDYNDNMEGTNANFHISNMSLQNCYSKFPNDSKQRIFQELVNSNSMSFSEKDLNCNVSTKSGTNDNQFKTVFKQNIENSYKNEIVSEKELDTEDISENVSKFGDFSENSLQAYSSKVKCEDTTEQLFRSVASPRNGDNTICPVLSFYKTYGTVSEGDLSDVLDEELEQLPEISQPGSLASSSVNLSSKHHKQQDQNRPKQTIKPKKHQDQNEHNQTIKNHKQQDQNRPNQTVKSEKQQEYNTPNEDTKPQIQHEQIIKSGSPEGEQEQQPTPSASSRQEPSPCDSGTRNKQGGTSRPIHRSISEVGLVDSWKVPSFFKSINDAKLFGLDKNVPLDIEEMIICAEEKDDSKKVTDHRKFAQPAKIAWDSGISNHRFEASLENATNKDIRTEKYPLTKFGDGHMLMSRSLSRDSALNDRLRIRRCALADPENMIMRQDVREKIQREVEKRKSSMVRRISQFFNVHLNLNKEEDLI